MAVYARDGWNLGLRLRNCQANFGGEVSRLRRHPEDQSDGDEDQQRGVERFHTITTSYYRGAMGIMLVYDITNAKSFDNIAKWLRNIDEHANEDVERMILGNKCDMEDKRS